MMEVGNFTGKPSTFIPFRCINIGDANMLGVNTLKLLLLVAGFESSSVLV